MSVEETDREMYVEARIDTIDRPKVIGIRSKFSSHSEIVNLFGF